MNSAECETDDDDATEHFVGPTRLDSLPDEDRIDTVKGYSGINDCINNKVVKQWCE